MTADQFFHNIKSRNIMLQDSQSRQCKQILRKNNLNPIKRLGKGGFGVVYLVSKTDFNTYETQLYSVKCTNKRSFVKKPVLRRYLKQQITLLESLQHENIVKLQKTFEDGGWIFMLMQYCNLGNLSTLQSQKPGKIYPLTEALDIIVSVIKGLEHMHKQNIIHRDIKPENILLTKSQKQDHKTVKICDLGFARQTQQNAQTFCGTTYYMAPQIHSKQKYDNKVDVWAVGVLLFNMLFGTHPFKSLNMNQQIKTKCIQGFQLENARINKNQSISKDCFQSLRQIFTKVFELDSEKRVTLNQLKQQVINLIPSNNNSPKNSLKATLESSDQCSEQQHPQFYIQEIDFVQKVKNEVCQLGFLTNIQELALRYYLDKVSLSILIGNDEDYTQASKHLPCNLMNQLKNNQNMDSVYLASNLSKLNIKKFSQVFSSNTSSDFKNYKQAYRLVIGHAFYRAHKTIENQKIKNQIKLKLFCCHVINRVFQKNNVQELFKYYYQWLCDRKKQLIFALPVVWQWIKCQQTQKIIDTVESINNRFYRKQK